MSKAKRGKSGSSSDVVNWEKELTFIPYNEEDWRAMVAFLLPQLHSDDEIVNLIGNAISSGVRKCFSVVNYDNLLAEAKEIASHGKAAGGKGKPPVPGKTPQFPEVCDFVKSALDKGEELSSLTLARLIKFKLLMIKNKDLDRRLEERKMSGTHSRAQMDGGSPTKGGSSPRKSQSPSKGKKGSKKEEKPSSPKKDTKLKKRGEDMEEIKTINDEPDGEKDPKHYIILTGFTDSSLISLLIDLKIPVASIMCLKSDAHLKKPAAEVEDEVGIMTQSRDPDDKKLEFFLHDFNLLCKYAPPHHLLHDVAKFDVIVKEDCFPHEPLDSLDSSKKIEFSCWLFDKVADVCYDVLDYEEQYTMYMNNLSIVDVQQIVDRSPSIMSQNIVVESHSGSTVVEASKESKQGRANDDLRYYDKLMSYIPIEVESIGLQLECLLQQVEALADGKNPMDVEREARQDGLSHLVGDYLDKKLTTFGLTAVEENKKPKIEEVTSNKIPQVVYYGDREKICSIEVGKNQCFNSKNVFENLMENHPYSAFVKYLQPKANEWIRSCARRQQLYNMCTEKDHLSVERFERAMRQYIFESLPLESGGEVSTVENEVIAEQQLEKISSRWDDPYCDMQQISSQLFNKPSTQDINSLSCDKIDTDGRKTPNYLEKSNSGDVNPKESLKSHSVIEEDNARESLSPDTTEKGETEKHEPETIALRRLDDYNWLEHFQPNVLFQILDSGSDLRPYLDTYYNRGNNTLLAVLHNPLHDNFQNSSTWATWLHSNVGFRDYLEYVAVEIDDWIKDQLKMIEEKEKEKIAQQTPIQSPLPTTVKDRSRWGMQTRAEINAANELNTPKENDKRKKSGKSRSRSGSPRKNAVKTPDKKGKGRKTPSAKKSSRGGTATKRPISSKSTVSFKDDIVKTISNPFQCAFTGYNLAPLLAHIHGEQTFLFPCDGRVIRIEKLKYIEGLMNVQISLYINGDVFMLNISNPVRLDLNEHVEKERSPHEETEEENQSASKNEGRASQLEEMGKTASALPDTLPDLPAISRDICSYSSLVATFKDGLIISNSASQTITHKVEHDGILQKISSISKQGSEAVQQSASSAPPKSPKGKRGKKEDDTRLQNDAMAKQKEEFLKKYAEREKDIINIYKARERKKNLFVTTPDGGHVTFDHLINMQCHDEEISDDNRVFLLKLEKFRHKDDNILLENVNKVHERHRVITVDGHVVKFLSNSTVEVYSPKGEIFKSLIKKEKKVVTPKTEKPEVAPQQAATNTATSNRASNNSKRSSKLSKPETEIEVEAPVIEEHLDEGMEWIVISPEGEQKTWKQNSTESEILDSLMVSKATCFESGQVLQTREDGLIIVDHPDGKKVVEFLDGTRFTNTAFEREVTDHETGECSLQKHHIVLVEFDGMPSIEVNLSKKSICCCYGNKKRIQGFHNGRYVVSNGNSPLMIIDENGNSLVHPNDENEEVKLLDEVTTNERPYCLLKQCSMKSLLYTDRIGNKFSVNHFGEHSVEKNEDGLSNPHCITPRYFVIYSDGSGDELLRHQDVAGYIDIANNDSSCAVCRDPVEGDKDASAVTVIKPYKGKTSNIWPMKKQCPNIIPPSLRERDFKTLPSASSKKTPPVIQSVTPYPSKSTKIVECLEIRHLIEYEKLTNDMRDQIIEGINRYGEFVQQQQDAEESLQIVDARNADEKETARQLQEKFHKLQGDTVVPETAPEEVLHEKYIEAVKPPPQTPPTKAYPKRPQSEWEKDKIELAEAKYAREMIRNRKFPPYFDTAEGQKFLSDNQITTDINKLTDELAFETAHPGKKSAVSMSTPTERTESTPPLAQTSLGLNESSPFDESCMSIRSSSLSMKFDSSSNTISPYFSSDGLQSLRPSNPTPKQSNDSDGKDVMLESFDDTSKLATIAEVAANTSDVEGLSFDETSLKRSGVDFLQKTDTLPNVKFATIEDPVRRQVKTASVYGSANMESTAKLRGFTLLPDFVDFGILREGVAYSYPVTLKNVGIDSCRFKIKQPPPSTGLKVLYKPGPVAAGMSAVFHVEIFAVAVGVEGMSGIGQVSYKVEITTETEHFYLPVIATIITQHEYEHPTKDTPSGGPSKGTLVLSERPSSRDNLTRRKKIE